MIRGGSRLDDFDLTLQRGLSKSDLRSLVSLEWCSQGKPVIMIGPTGVGKSYLVRALGLLAFEADKTSLFISVTDFLESLVISRSSNWYLRFREILVRTDLLILDDLMDRLASPGLTFNLQGDSYRQNLHKKEIAKKGAQE